jgi:hypothetical protein
MVSDLAGYAIIIYDCGAKREAMPRKVRASPRRYHNHLDKNINNAEWSAEEEQRLFDLQDEIGNKWALISNKLPGRYVRPHPGPTTASRTTSTPNCARVSAKSTRKYTSSSKRSTATLKPPRCTE